MSEMVINLIFAAIFTGVLNETPVLIYRYLIKKAPCKPGAKTWWLTFLYSVVVNVLFNFALMQIGYDIDDMDFAPPMLWIIVSYFVIIHGYGKSDVIVSPDGPTIRHSHVPTIIMSCIAAALAVFAFYLYGMYRNQETIAGNAIQQYKDMQSQYSDLQNQYSSLESDYNDLDKEYQGTLDDYDDLIRESASAVSSAYDDGYYQGYYDAAFGY